MVASLKKLIQSEILVAPGVFDGLSAILAENAGFKALYASGGAIARSAGFPDIGLLSFTEMLSQIREIVAAAKLPVIADADTGFGGELNVARTVKEYEQSGVSALHIEDQSFPKRCGHLAGKNLIPPKEMAIKIASALKARKSDEFLVIARTDAIAVEGFDKALERAKLYAKVGADLLFVEAPETRDQVEKIASIIPGPKLINMFQGGKTPLIPLEDLKAMGYQIVIIPSDLQRAAIFAMQKTLEAISNHGDSRSVNEQMVSFKDREKLIKTDDYFAFADQIEKEISRSDN
jgi:2-methylisocitrate lyase-like PEP mutase family enzyme